MTLLGVLTACSLPQVSAEDRLFLPLSLEFLGSYTLDTKTFNDTTVGGLSALTYDRQQEQFYAVSDDRSERAPARFYTLKLEIDTASGQPSLKQVNIQNVTLLKDKEGKTFAPRTIDPEGLALSQTGAVWISSEGVVKDGVPPFIGEFDLKTGQMRRTLPIPEAYLPDSSNPTQQQRGIRDNLGFEALTVSANGTPTDPFRLFAAVESPLIQDLDPPDPQQSAKNRLLHYLIEGDRATIISEHVYPLEPKPMAAVDHGLTELLSIDQAGHFLSLERTFSLSGFQVKLFQTATGTATDSSTIESLRGDLKGTQLARKRELFDFSQLGITIDNLEGMTLGPRLPDRSQSLILVSDDNFNTFTQVTQFLLFRVKGLKS
ncbi:endonuclease/exonuclease/phosphatase [Myxacorys almedinensis A]|uniref:Endonuclease/exonuclease/phosphatase n=2 Tax=Myxacorys TaxID=2056239 RepID=A0A8J7Z3Q5_9CYAN|nr:endonuclease/exonuclease/phosphatase [Myxacorys almedinensis A]